jgi:hypothetical protein
MKCNIATWDRALRIFTGFILLTWAFMGGPWWMFIGVISLATGAWGFSPTYALLKTGTLREKS